VIAMLVLLTPAFGQEYGQGTPDQPHQTDQNQNPNQPNQNQGSQTQMPDQQPGQTPQDPSTGQTNTQDTQSTQQGQRESDRQDKSGDRQTTESEMAGATGSDSSLSQQKGQDWKFLNKAAMSGMLELKLGQLAVERGSSQAVKDFGQKMVDQHTKANQELMSIAQNKGISLSQNTEAKHQKTYDKLSQLNGTEFDAAYMKQMEQGIPETGRKGRRQ
jgi:putative membrane protein